jgi:ferritin-like protein
MAKFQGMSEPDKLNDLQILNRALFFEHRAVWTYRVGAEKLTATEIGKAVLSLAEQNQRDHEQHQDMLGNAISDLGGTPVQMTNSYDLSSYIKRGDGNVDNDVNIARLALALEVAASVGYIADTAQLKSPVLVELEGGIAAVEAIHAARIREAFNALGMKVPVVPRSIISKDVRSEWIIRVSSGDEAQRSTEMTH